jgi:hypothetical protein
MRTTVPPAFSATFEGLEGLYTLHFQPTDEWDGVIDVTIAGLAMRWEVVNSDREEDGGVVLGGMTSGTEDIWQDRFWFEVRMNDTPPVIQYWGDRVIWREDAAV